MSNLPDSLQKEYAMRFSHMAAYRGDVWKMITRQYFQKLIGPGKIVLDLGSGWGEFINNIQASEKLAMDLNPDGKTRVAEGVRFLHQDSSQPWPLPDASLDIVFTSNFFEHLPSKECLSKTLHQAHRCLKPSGKIICLGPNIRYVGNAYWDFFDHHLPLTHLSLEEGLSLADFQVLSVIPKFIPYTMAQGRTPPLFLVALYLKMPFLWPLFGRQFLITAGKRVHTV